MGRAAAAAAPGLHQREPSEPPPGIMGGQRWLPTSAWMTSQPSWRGWAPTTCHLLDGFATMTSDLFLGLTRQASLSMDETSRQTSSHSLSSASTCGSASVRRPGPSQRHHRRTGSVGTVSEQEVRELRPVSLGLVLPALAHLAPVALCATSGAFGRPRLALLRQLCLRGVGQLGFLHGLAGQRPSLQRVGLSCAPGRRSQAESSPHRGTRVFTVCCIIMVKV